MLRGKPHLGQLPFRASRDHLGSFPRLLQDARLVALERVSGVLENELPLLALAVRPSAQSLRLTPQPFSKASMLLPDYQP